MGYAGATGTEWMQNTFLRPLMHSSNVTKMVESSDSLRVKLSITFLVLAAGFQALDFNPSILPSPRQDLTKPTDNQTSSVLLLQLVLYSLFAALQFFGLRATLSIRKHMQETLIKQQQNGARMTTFEETTRLPEVSFQTILLVAEVAMTSAYHGSVTENSGAEMAAWLLIFTSIVSVCDRLFLSYVFSRPLPILRVDVAVGNDNNEDPTPVEAEQERPLIPRYDIRHPSLRNRWSTSDIPDSSYDD